MGVNRGQIRGAVSKLKGQPLLKGGLQHTLGGPEFKCKPKQTLRRRKEHHSLRDGGNPQVRRSSDLAGGFLESFLSTMVVASPCGVRARGSSEGSEEMRLNSVH